MTIEIENEFNKGTIIKVIGVGGGGGNAVMHMIDMGVQGVEFINANTDSQALKHIPTHQVLRLGNSGLGAGSKPEKGRDAALEAEQEIKAALEGAHMLFITAGMGGGTGTGAAPVIARIAKDMGILTVGVVTKPFDWEGVRRTRNAEDGLRELEDNVDSLIVVLNEKLLEVLGEDITQEEAFAFANNVLKNAVGGISEIINEYGQVNVDFEDIKTVMGEPGRAMMGTAVANGPERARVAAEQAIACPLLEGVDLACAKGVLVLVSASRGSLKLSESKAAMSTVNKYASSECHIIYGAAYDDTLNDKIRVTVIATGLSKKIDKKLNVKTQMHLEQSDNQRTLPESAFMSPNSFSGGNINQGNSNNNVPVQTTNEKKPAVWRSAREPVASKGAFGFERDTDIDVPAFLVKQMQKGQKS